VFEVADGKLKVHKVGGTDNPADVMTKVLARGEVEYKLQLMNLKIRWSEAGGLEVGGDGGGVCKITCPWIGTRGFGRCCWEYRRAALERVVACVLVHGGKTAGAEAAAGGKQAVANWSDEVSFTPVLNVGEASVLMQLDSELRGSVPEKSEFGSRSFERNWRGSEEGRNWSFRKEGMRGTGETERDRQRELHVTEAGAMRLRHRSAW
jgi:hypothetical protein